jgi:hypothetical protein
VKTDGSVACWGENNFGQLNAPSLLGLAPAITSASSAGFTAGVPGSFEVTATGSPTPALSMTGAPTWLALTDHGDGTATLAGTPPAGSPAASPYSFTVTASNGVPPDATQAFTLTVAKASPTVTAVATPGNASFGQPVTVTARVTAPATDTLPPTGTVSFYLNGASTPIATVTLGSDGGASFHTTALGGGVNTVVAVYSGDANFVSATSDAATVSIACTISGPYSGGVLVPTGQTLTICDATVTGGITVAAGGSLDVENSTIQGSISSAKAGPIRICGSTTGAVNVSYSTDWVLIGDQNDGCAPNTINGGLTLVRNQHGLQVIDNTVTGAIAAVGNTGAGPFPDDTTARVTGNHH